jgi:hypothetical protein
MRRPGSNHVTELFSDACDAGGLVRPARKSKREAPFSLRLSAEEKNQLKLAAGHMALGAYIKARLFDDLPAVPRQRGYSALDHKLITQLLAVLGQSRLSSNMNQIAKAAHLGTLPVEPDLVDELKSACADIRKMRVCLFRALGRKETRK